MTNPTMKATGLDLRIEFVDAVQDSGYGCEECGLDNAWVHAEIHYTYREDTEDYDRSKPCCLACVIPAIDRIDWLDTDRPVTVEVDRAATDRPF